MSLVIADDHVDVALTPPGGLKLVSRVVTFPAAYVQNEALTPTAFALEEVVSGWAVLTSPGAGTINIANVIYDYANDKIRLYDETPAQVAGEAAIGAGVTALVFAFGRAS